MFENNQEIGNILVLCINSKCNNEIKLKDAFRGETITDFYCSAKCKHEDLMRNR